MADEYSKFISNYKKRYEDDEEEKTPSQEAREEIKQEQQTVEQPSSDYEGFISSYKQRYGSQKEEIETAPTMQEQEIKQPEDLVEEDEDKNIWQKIGNFANTLMYGEKEEGDKRTNLEKAQELFLGLESKAGKKEREELRESTQQLKEGVIQPDTVDRRKQFTDLKMYEFVKDKIDYFDEVLYPYIEARTGNKTGVGKGYSTVVEKGGTKDIVEKDTGKSIFTPEQKEMYNLNIGALREAENTLGAELGFYYKSEGLGQKYVQRAFEATQVFDDTDTKTMQGYQKASKKLEKMIREESGGWEDLTAKEQTDIINGYAMDVKEGQESPKSFVASVNELVGGSLGYGFTMSALTQSSITGQTPEGALSGIAGVLEFTGIKLMEAIGLNAAYNERTKQDYYETTTPEYALLVDTAGDVFIERLNDARKEEGEKSMMWAEVGTTLETFSESWGEILGMGSEVVLDSLVKTRVFNRFAQWALDNKKKLAMGSINQILKEGKFDGVLGEFLEEELLEPLSAIIQNREYYGIDTPEGRERMLTELVGFSITGGVGNIQAKNQLRKRQNEARQYLQEQGLSQELIAPIEKDIPQQDDTGDIGEGIATEDKFSELREDIEKKAQELEQEPKPIVEEGDIDISTFNNDQERGLQEIIYELEGDMDVGARKKVVTADQEGDVTVGVEGVVLPDYIPEEFRSRELIREAIDSIVENKVPQEGTKVWQVYQSILEQGLNRADERYGGQVEVAPREYVKDREGIAMLEDSVEMGVYDKKSSYEQESLKPEEKVYYHGLTSDRWNKFQENNLIPAANQAFGGEFSITDDYDLAKQYAGDGGAILQVRINEGSTVAQASQEEGFVDGYSLTDIGEGEYLVSDNGVIKHIEGVEIDTEVVQEKKAPKKKKKSPELTLDQQYELDQQGIELDKIKDDIIDLSMKYSDEAKATGGVSISDLMSEADKKKVQELSEIYDELSSDLRRKLDELREASLQQDPLDMDDLPFRTDKDGNKTLDTSKLNPMTVQEIKDENRRIFGDDKVKIMEQILTPEGMSALGKYANTWIEIRGKQADVGSTYHHEAVHKAMDVFLNANERQTLLDAVVKLYGEKDLKDRWAKLPESEKYRIMSYQSNAIDSFVSNQAVVNKAGFGTEKIAKRVGMDNRQELLNSYARDFGIEPENLWGSSVQVVDTNTGERSIYLVDGQTDAVHAQALIDATDFGMAGENVDGKVYHITALRESDFTNAFTVVEGVFDPKQLPYSQDASQRSRQREYRIQFGISKQGEVFRTAEQRLTNLYAMAEEQLAEDIISYMNETRTFTGKIKRMVDNFIDRWFRGLDARMEIDKFYNGLLKGDLLQQQQKAEKKRIKNFNKYLDSIQGTGVRADVAYRMEVAKELQKLTTKILNRLKERSNKPVVSKQFILDLTKQQDIKKVEADIIKDVLKNFDDKVEVATFENKVLAELLPLERQQLGDTKYEAYTIDKNDPDWFYSENIYYSPIPVRAGSAHFGHAMGAYMEDVAEKYFGHTRVENNATNTTRRVIEVQTDLYQKGQLEKEAEVTPTALNPENEQTLEQLNETLEYYIKELKREDSEYNRNKLKETENEIDFYKRRETEAKEKKERIAILSQYKDPTAHLRMVREEVRQASIDGVKELLFPTGFTARYIEGFVKPNKWTDLSGNILENNKGLKYGDYIRDTEYDDAWVVVGINEDNENSITARPQRGIATKEEGTDFLSGGVKDTIIKSFGFDFYRDGGYQIPKDSTETIAYIERKKGKVSKDLFIALLQDSAETAWKRVGKKYDTDMRGVDELVKKEGFDGNDLNDIAGIYKDFTWSVETIQFGERNVVDDIPQVKTVVDFYDKTLGKYLKNQYGAVEIKDKKDKTWFKVDIKPEYSQAVEAFRVDELVDYTGVGKEVEEQNKQQEEVSLKLPELVTLAEDLGADVQVKGNIGKSKGGIKLGDFTPQSEYDSRVRVLRKLFEPQGEEVIDASTGEVTRLDETQEQKTERMNEVERVLAHEIGHLWDWFGGQDNMTLKRGNILGRIGNLRKYMEKEFRGFENKEIRNELKAITQLWSPFDENAVPPKYKQYRYSSKELYAEAISMLLNDPARLKQTAPNFYQGFTEFLGRKENVRKTFFSILDSIEEERYIQERLDRMDKGFEEARGRRMSIDEKKEAYKKQRKWENVITKIKFGIAETHAPYLDKLRKRVKEGGMELSKLQESEQLMQNLAFLGNDTGKYAEDIQAEFFDPISEAGIGADDVGKILVLERDLGDRVDLANPQGLQYDYAQETYDALKKKFTPAQWNVLQEKLTWWRDYNFEIVKKAHEAGLYSDKFMQEVAMVNKNTYTPFAVIKYIEDNYVTAGIIQAKGTLKKVENPINTQMLKSLSIIRATAINLAKNDIVSTLQENFKDDIIEAKAIRGEEGRFVKWEANKDAEFKGMDIIELNINGVRRGFYVDSFIKDMFESPLRGTGWEVARIITTPIRMFNRIFKPAVTTFKPSFQFYSNPIRDITRSLGNLSGLTGWMNQNNENVALRTGKVYKAYLGEWIKSLKQSWNYAGGEMDAVTKKLQDNYVLSKEVSFYDIDLGTEDVSFDPVKNKVAYKGKVNWLDSVLNWGRKVPVMKSTLVPIADLYVRLGKTIETNSKIAGFKYLTDKAGLSDKKAAYYTRKYVGTPNYMQKGQFTPLMNELAVFSNVQIQATMSSFELATNAKTASGYWFSKFFTAVAPKLLMLAGASLLKMSIPDPDDPEKEKEINPFDYASEYDKSNYTVIPIGYDEQTKKVLYMRIPAEDDDTTIGNAVWKLGRILQGQGMKIEQLGVVAVGLVPLLSGENPFMGLTEGWLDYLQGRNPYDDYRGRPAIGIKKWEEGGLVRFNEMLKWSSNEIGLTNFVTYDKDLDTTYEKVLQAPILERMFRLSDYGITEREQWEKDMAKKDKGKELSTVLQDYYAQPSDENMLKYQDKYVQLVKGDEPKEGWSGTDKAEATRLKGEFKKEILVKSGDDKYRRVAEMTKNEDKLEYIEKQRKGMSKDEYGDYLAQLVRHEVVKGEMFAEYAEIKRLDSDAIYKIVEQSIPVLNADSNNTLLWELRKRDMFTNEQLVKLRKKGLLTSAGYGKYIEVNKKWYENRYEKETTTTAKKELF